MKNLSKPASAKFTLTKTTITRFTKPQQAAGLFTINQSSIVDTTSVLAW